MGNIGDSQNQGGANAPQCHPCSYAPELDNKSFDILIICFLGTKYLQSRFECEDVFMPEKVNLKLRKRRFDLTHTIYLEKAETQAPRKPIRLVHVTKV